MPDQYGRDMREVRQISVPRQGLPSFTRQKLDFTTRGKKGEEQMAAEREAKYQESLRHIAEKERKEKEWREDKRLRAESARFEQEQDREVELDEDNLP
ncbi:hypothetical protein ACEPPN_008351 [Leptodophora sp. 'Broadleaf-Isolate-01']